MKNLLNELSNSSTVIQRDTIFASYRQFILRLFQTMAIASLLSYFLSTYIVVKCLIEMKPSVDVSFLLFFFFCVGMAAMLWKRLAILDEVAFFIYHDDVFESEQNCIDVFDDVA